MNRDAKLLKDAASAYQDLYQQWIDSGNKNWWANGNIFDTLVDYLTLAQAWPAAMEDLALAGLQVY